METVSNRARVLVVDEQSNFRAEIEGMLGKSEYSTVLSRDSDEAIARIEQDPPYDLVLSELRTAGREANALLERMRQVQPDTPLVLVTPSHDVAAAHGRDAQRAPTTTC